jgi:hypothetical protein
MICLAACFTSTGEPHERIYAPHTMHALTHEFLTLAGAPLVVRTRPSAQLNGPARVRGRPLVPAGVDEVAVNLAVR